MKNFQNNIVYDDLTSAEEKFDNLVNFLKSKNYQVKITKFSQGFRFLHFWGNRAKGCAQEYHIQNREDSCNNIIYFHCKDRFNKFGDSLFRFSIPSSEEQLNYVYSKLKWIFETNKEEIEFDLHNEWDYPKKLKRLY